ncbi:MAG: efflux RND transporter permease subunit, partial [Chloroflexia bacterium]|nr:efflux RND transporter permease subunit [Chloroflexia bacterium]
LSWVFAMIQTPFMAKYFYRKERPKGEKTESYDKGVYKYFQKLLNWALRNKGKFLIGSIAVLLISFYAFRFISVNFMPGIDYNQFIVEYKLPRGADIEKVEQDALKLQEYIKNIDGVKFATTSIGQPPARYTLMRQMPTGGQNYAEVIVETEEISHVNEIIPQIKQHLAENYPDAETRVLRVGAAFSDYNVEVEFSGPDPLVLRQLAEEAKTIMKNEPSFEIVTDNWKNPTKKLTPKYSVDRAQKLGLTRKDMANSILVATTGMPIGAFYEGDKQIPVVLKTDKDIAQNMEGLLSIPVWGERSVTSVPLNQIADTISLKWEDELVNRFNGKRAIKVQANVFDGVTAFEAQAKIQEKIESMELPDGYTMRWDGETASSSEANSALFAFLPLAVGLMLIIIIALFNNLKQASIIFIVVPFAFMGISLGFNIMPISFGFTAIIGALGLIGMMIKNAVVLLDEINLGIKNGKSQLTATIDAAISRMRPVMMASLTTILGMLPLISDSMFQSMAVTIMFGLLVGSVVTLIVVPVLYAVFFKVDVSELKS